MKYLFTILTLLLLIDSIKSQTVGLVLSGGGAKGFAHIGVIKALEENNIPIDYIAGTSMGAVVGALYAIGYSPEEMVELFKSNDFKNWSKGIIDENQRYTVNENWDDASILTFEVRVDSTFLMPVLPSYIVPTQQMDLAFMDLFASGTAISGANFDNLFVPFRCIASDIQNKKQVVFRSGDLGEAVRASMTVPIYFKPLVINGKMLFDGGIYNNFPWKELKNDFNPGYIIGSKVASNTKPPKEDDILLQLENMIVGQTDYLINDSSSTLIQTTLKDISLMDFSNVDYIVNEGYTNTMKRIDTLKRNIIRSKDFKDLTKNRKEFKKSLPERKFKSIKFIGITTKQRSYIEKFLSSRTKDKSIVNLREEYYRLITEDFIKRLYPIAVYDTSTNLFDLTVAANFKKNIDVSLGGNVSSSSINQGFVSASYHFLGNTANKVYANVYFGRLYSSLDLSFKKKFPWKLPFTFEVSLIYNRLDYYRSAGELFFEDVKPSYIIKNEAFSNYEFSLPLSKSITLSNSTSIGALDNEYYQIDNYTKQDIPDKTYFSFVNSALKIEKRTLNKKQYSYRGRKMFLKMNYINGREEHVPGSTSPEIDKTHKYHSWFNIKVYNESYHRIISNSFWVGLVLDANYSNKPFFNNSKASLLTNPSFNPTPHSKTLFLNSLRSDKYFALGLIPNVRIFKETFLRAELYSFQPIKELLLTNEPEEIYSTALKSVRFLGSLALVVHTPVGPLSLSINYYPKEVKEYYFIFNYGFILFNKRALE